MRSCCCSAWRCRGGWRRSSAATDRLNCGGATACGAATYCKPTSIEQRGSGSLVIYIVRRPGSPAIGARIVDPDLLVYCQTQAAYDPQFIVQDEPVIALARPARCWQYGDSTPRVGGRVVSVLCAWRSRTTYHVDFAIEQHTCHVALARGHRRPGGVAIRTRVIDENCVCDGGERCGVTGDHVHQAVESCRRRAAAWSGHSHAATPGVGCSVIDLHCIEGSTEANIVELIRHIYFG